MDVARHTLAFCDDGQPCVEFSSTLLFAFALSLSHRDGSKSEHGQSHGQQDEHDAGIGVPPEETGDGNRGNDDGADADQRPPCRKAEGGDDHQEWRCTEGVLADDRQ